MLRRMFMKGLLASPVALVSGKEERFVVDVSDSKINGRDETAVTYYLKDGSTKVVRFPKGRWQGKEVMFTRVQEKP